MAQMPPIRCNGDYTCKATPAKIQVCPNCKTLLAHQFNNVTTGMDVYQHVVTAKQHYSVQQVLARGFTEIQMGAYPTNDCLLRSIELAANIVVTRKSLVAHLTKHGSMLATLFGHNEIGFELNSVNTNDFLSDISILAICEEHQVRLEVYSLFMQTPVVFGPVNRNVAGTICYTRDHFIPLAPIPPVVSAVAQQQPAQQQVAPSQALVPAVANQPALNVPVATLSNVATTSPPVIVPNTVAPTGATSSLNLPPPIQNAAATQQPNTVISAVVAPIPQPQTSPIKISPWGVPTNAASIANKIAGTTNKIFADYGKNWGELLNLNDIQTEKVPPPTHVTLRSHFNVDVVDEVVCLMPLDRGRVLTNNEIANYVTQSIGGLVTSTEVVQKDVTDYVLIKPRPSRKYNASDYASQLIKVTITPRISLWRATKRLASYWMSVLMGNTPKWSLIDHMSVPVVFSAMDNVLEALGVNFVSMATFMTLIRTEQAQWHYNLMEGQRDRLLNFTYAPTLLSQALKMVPKRDNNERAVAAITTDTEANISQLVDDEVNTGSIRAYMVCKLSDTAVIDSMQLDTLNPLAQSKGNEDSKPMGLVSKCLGYLVIYSVISVLLLFAGAHLENHLLISAAWTMIFVPLTLCQFLWTSMTQKSILTL